jgi:(2Fe-2S) ferredoxin
VNPATPKKYRVIVCRGPECGDQRGSSSIHAAFQAEIARRGLGASCELGWQSCFGRCRQGPNVLVKQADPQKDRFTFAVAPLLGGQNMALYNGVQPTDVGRILSEHVTAGRLVRDLIKKPEYGTVVGETLRSQRPVGEGEPESGGGSGVK